MYILNTHERTRCIKKFALSQEVPCYVLIGNSFVSSNKFQPFFQNCGLGCRFAFWRFGPFEREKRNNSSHARIVVYQYTHSSVDTTTASTTATAATTTTATATATTATTATTEQATR